MIKIGFFSKLSQVPVKTLRYYDEIGLLKPLKNDPFTGYRYYSISQLSRLNRILALKDLSLSLEQIALLLAKGLPVEQLRGMLRLKEIEIEAEMKVEQEKLARVAVRLKQIEQENKMSNYDVVIKNVEAQEIVSLREIIPTYPEQGQLWEELEGVLVEKKIKAIAPCFTLYHADEPEIDAEVCEPIAKDDISIEHPRVKSRSLKGAEMATLIHHGPYATLSNAYEALVKWIESNGYRINGPYREIYLQPPSESGNQQDHEAITEIQFPVEKI
ncbi:MAG: MerR family transcriptional regulator [Anaerolineae bacterium]|jgi:effector-binding domain-containing protein|nr:MerR family transcriptional regulator [Anaerolineae bacterium]